MVQTEQPQIPLLTNGSLRIDHMQIAVWWRLFLYLLLYLQTSIVNNSSFTDLKDVNTGEFVKRNRFIRKTESKRDRHVFHLTRNGNWLPGHVSAGGELNNHRQSRKIRFTTLWKLDEGGDTRF